MYLIKHVELDSDQATVILNKIPSGYAHLLLKINARTDRNTNFDNIKVLPNGSSAGNTRYMFGGSSSVITGTEGFPTAYTGGGTGYWGNTSVYIYDYASTNSNKGIQMDSVSTSNSMLSSSAWSDSTPINSITLAPGDGTVLKAGSTFSLYLIPGTLSNVVSVA
jgi:hypothetical protein